MRALIDRLQRGGFPPVIAVACALLAARVAVGGLADGAGLALEKPGTRDFVQYWAAHQALESGRNAYDGEVMFQIEDGIGQRDDETILMWNPPWTALLLEPVVTLPFPKAALLWFVTSTILLTGIAILLPEALGRSTPHLVVAALAAGCFYPAAQCLVWGQLSIFLTFFFVLFLYFVRKGEMCAAGLALTPLTTKPHLFFLLAVPGLAWLAQLPARQRRAFLAGAVGGLAVMLTITVLRWPEALPWWKASLSATPTGPGAVAMETWKTSTLSTLVRSVMADATGAAPRWPMWAIPLVGFVTTAFVFARRRDPIVWADVAPPLMCLSLTLGCYGWTYDQTLLLPVQMALACDAVAAHDRAAAWRVAGVLIAVQVLAVVIGARSGAAHDDFIWLPWAMLAAWFYARRSLGDVTTRA